MPHPALKTELGIILSPLALNADMEDKAEGGTPSYEAPDWIPILPAPNGSLLKGVDGRVFDMDDLERVVSNSPMPAALDFDHAASMAPFAAQPGKAAARIVELQVRDDATTWGKVAWTEAGRAAVERGEYLFVSPVLQVSYSSDGPPEVKYISGAGLVNFPNFRVMPSINHQEFPAMPDETAATTAGTQTAGTATSGAPAEPTTGAAPNAQATDPGTGTATPAEPADTGTATLEQMRRELNAVRQELTDTRQELATQRTESDAERKRLRDTAINAAVDKAIETGRIPPAQREYFVAQCQKENGLEEFEAHVATLPQMVGDAGLAGRTPPGTDEVTLSAQEQEFCRKSGLDPEKFLATKKEEQAAGRRIYPPGL